ncbi:phosphoethanolamine--lipid A transferase [Ignatzschineria larvae DSM 13226]|uniref:Phosphoethanolamine--lipid A transferase n=1 Tax=Ignatzschineria larvae DSM 13226 TaxID=1111732 RepID=A0ABZ3BYU6_9GAMM|nr:phosphoethanolamine--lipid A transferase [Ignatzschineria larvae]
MMKSFLLLKTYFAKWQVQLPLYLVLLLTSLLLAAVENIVFWREFFYLMSFDGFGSYLFAFSVFLVLWSANLIIVSCLLWRRIGAGILLILLLLCTIFNYYSYRYQIYMDRDMLINIIETHSGEVVNLLSFQLVIWILLGVLVPFALYLLMKVRPISWWKSLLQRVLLIIGALLLSGAIALIFYKDYASFFRNHRQVQKLIMPISYATSAISYLKKQYEDQLPFEKVGEDATLQKPAGSEKTLFVIVVGETARSKNFSLNGYQKETNPLLAQQEVISFREFYSCGTATAISVPCMFSRLTRANFDKSRAQNQENALDILQRVGYKVLWRENDNGCKGVCDRVPTEFVEEYVNQPQSITGFYHDEYLLENLKSYIESQENQDENLVIVLHMNGSHGPTYYQRYPDHFRHFTPSCDTNKIENCDLTALENVYDNTIRYTDYVLNETIELLKSFDGEYETSMIYLSDHGESLGENRFYLHGAPYAIAPKEQTHVPFIFWANQDFYQNRQLNQNCLSTIAKADPFSQDNFFHSLLGLLSVKTKEYDESMDLFKACSRVP